MTLEQIYSSTSFKLYQRALAGYQSGERWVVYRPLVGCLMRLAVIGLGFWRGVRFPRRKTGGWWWVSRWRLEFLMGWCERESVSWCRQLIQPGMTVVDVGAHIGYYSRLLSELVGPTGRVLAFEPCPENHPVLRRNLARRRYRNTEVFTCALSDQTGSRTLYLSPGHTNHSLLPGYTEMKGMTQVVVATLDGLLAERQIEKVDFIKIDVEGAEPLVLNGMRRTIARSNRLTMLVEYNPSALSCGGIKPEELGVSLRQMGFMVRAILPDGTLGEIPDNVGAGAVNLLCQKSA